MRLATTLIALGLLLPAYVAVAEPIPRSMTEANTERCVSEGSKRPFCACFYGEVAANMSLQRYLTAQAEVTGQQNRGKTVPASIFSVQEFENAFDRCRPLR